MHRVATPMINSAAIISTAQAFVSFENAHRNAANITNATFNHCQSSSSHSQLAITSAIRERETESASSTSSHMMISALKLNRSMKPKATALSQENCTALATQSPSSPQETMEKTS